MSFTPKKCPPGCVYAMHDGNIRYCGYILITGHMRDCEPGYGCIRYSRGNRSKSEDFYIKRPLKSCEICGKKFPPRNIHSKYCSKACAKEADRRRPCRKKQYRPATPKPCDICGREFIPYRSSVKRCSTECQLEWRRRDSRERMRERAKSKKKGGEYGKTEPISDEPESPGGLEGSQKDTDARGD